RDQERSACASQSPRLSQEHTCAQVPAQASQDDSAVRHLSPAPRASQMRQRDCRPASRRIHLPPPASPAPHARRVGTSRPHHLRIHPHYRIQRRPIPLLPSTAAPLDLLPPHPQPLIL